MLVAVDVPGGIFLVYEIKPLELSKPPTKTKTQTLALLPQKNSAALPPAGMAQNDGHHWPKSPALLENDWEMKNDIEKRRF